MAQPITWRNVDAPSFGEAGRLLGQASQSINAGFDNLQKTLADHQTKQSQMALIDYQSALAGAKTPEEVAAVEATRGDFLARMGVAEQAKTIGAGEARNNTLRDSLTKQWVFDDTKTDRDQRPLVQDFYRLAATDTKAAQAFLDSNPQLRNSGVLAGDLRKTIQGNDQHTWAGNQDKRGDTELELRRTAQEETRRHNQAQEGISRSQVAATLQAAAMRRAGSGSTKASDKKEGDALAALEKRGIYGNGEWGSESGLEAITKAMKTLGYSDTQSKDVIYNLGKYYNKGVEVTGTDGKKQYVPLPANLVIQELANADENAISSWIPGWSRRGDDLDNRLKQRIKDPEVIQAMVSGSGIKQATDLRNLVRSGIAPGASNIFPPLSENKSTSTIDASKPIPNDKKALANELNALLEMAEKTPNRTLPAQLETRYQNLLSKLDGLMEKESYTRR